MHVPSCILSVSGKEVHVIVNSGGLGAKNGFRGRIAIGGALTRNTALNHGDERGSHDVHGASAPHRRGAILIS